MAERDDELAATATRTQQRGPITDYFGCGPYEREIFGSDPLVGDRRLALCRCVHGKEWVEGGFGGTEADVCKKCARVSYRQATPWRWRAMVKLNVSRIPAAIGVRFGEGRRQRVLILGAERSSRVFYVPLHRWQDTASGA